MIKEVNLVRAKEISWIQLYSKKHQLLFNRIYRSWSNILMLRRFQYQMYSKT